MSRSEDIEITLALPCYNEGENIQTVLQRSVEQLNRLKMSWEILVVDNHSSDDTAAVVSEFIRREPRTRLIVHDRNRLYSGSCRTILENSRGRYVAIMDSDGQFTADDLPDFLAVLNNGANLVFGWRHRRVDPLMRKMMSLVFNALGKFYLRYPLHDLNVGLRVFDRRFIAAATIRHAMNMVNPELYVRARQAGLIVGEVPVQHAERSKGQTSHDFAKLGRLFRDVVRYFRNLGQELTQASPPATAPSRAKLTSKAAA